MDTIRQPGKTVMPSFSLYGMRRISGKELKISINRLIMSLGVIAYPLALLWALRDIVSVVFAHEGYAFRPPVSPVEWIIVLALAIFPGSILPLSGIRPSHAVIWILYILAYVPAQIVPVFSSGQTLKIYGPFQVTLAIGFLIVLLFGAFPPIRLRLANMNPNLFWLTVAAFSGFVYASVVQQYGFPDRVPGLGDVYDVRSQFGEEGIGGAPYLPYVMGWQYKIVNPLLMIVGLARRSPIFLGMGTFGQLALYSYSGHKTVLFSLLLVFGLYFLTRQSGRWLGLGFASGALATIVAAVVFDLLAGSIWGTSLFVRRLIMVPGMLTGYYHDYFSQHSFTLQFGPFLRWAVESPYTMSVPNTIGSAYFGNAEMSANVNLWADGYASFGYLGILLSSIVLGFIVWAFNSVGLGDDPRVATIVAGVASFSWVNSALMTSFASHGIGFALLLLFFLPVARVGGGQRQQPSHRPYRKDATGRGLRRHIVLHENIDGKRHQLPSQKKVSRLHFGGRAADTDAGF